METGPEAPPEHRATEDVASAVRRLYEYVLDAGGVDEHEGFFALGGSSLLVVELLELVSEELRVQILPEDFYRAPTLAGLRALVERQRVAGPAEPVPPAPDLAALLAKSAAAGPPGRTAVAGPDGAVSYGELADLVAAAAQRTVGRPMEPESLRVPTSAAGVRSVLTRFAARRPVVLLDPDATAAECEAAWRAFAAEFPPGASEPDGYGVHGLVTSGSTGQPKVVMTPYDGMLAVQGVHAELHRLGPEDVYLVMAPLHYGYGLQAGLLVGLLSGATVVLPAHPLTLESLRACAEQHRITMTMGVSFAYRILLAADAPLPGLRRAMVGGDPLPPDIASAWRERTTAPLMDSYGCSEVEHVSVNTDGVPGSVGRPLDCVELRVRHEDGTLAGSGVGELLVRSPGLARGYAGDPELTAEKFRDGWYHTGDLAELREDGHILLRGRLDDRINVAGTMVDAGEVEQACREALGVTDCAVIGVPGATGVVELRAYVVARRRVSRADVMRALTGRLSRHKIPGRVVQLDALPRSANGKLIRSELPR